MAADDDQFFLFGGEASPPPPSSASREAGEETSSASRPLAARMRPRGLEEVAGQAHLLGGGALLPRLIREDRFGSLLFYGPPGCGKTTLAEVIAAETKSRFVRLNAVLTNVAELREHLRFARARPQERTILFLDELHRFNRAQQDLLLPDVEEGHIRLIGATTHNPGFYVNAPLLSRSHLFRLESLRPEDVAAVVEKALHDAERGLGAMGLQVEDGVVDDLARLADGDLRRALGALETLALAAGEGGSLTRENVAAFARERQIRYDKNEDEHYDTASAFIKSVRGGDPDAALYWMVKMLAGGEDPRFVARRLVILASEDVGLADPRALPLAVSCFQACEQVGLPECELNLAHTTIFLAAAPKSNSATLALGAAKKALRDEPLQRVPLHLRDAHTKLNRSLGHGEGYRYSHEWPEAISGQEYLEKPLALYTPQDAGAEKHIAERLARWQELKARLQSEEES